MVWIACNVLHEQAYDSRQPNDKNAHDVDSFMATRYKLIFRDYTQFKDGSFLAVLIANANMDSCPCFVGKGRPGPDEE